MDENSMGDIREVGISKFELFNYSFIQFQHRHAQIQWSTSFRALLRSAEPPAFPWKFQSDTEIFQGRQGELYKISENNNSPQLGDGTAVA